MLQTRPREMLQGVNGRLASFAIMDGKRELSRKIALELSLNALEPQCIFQCRVSLLAWHPFAVAICRTSGRTAVRPGSFVPGEFVHDH